MCGRLKLEKLDKMLGSPVSIEFSGNRHEGFWNSHTRQESEESWHSKGWQEARLPGVSAFTEGHPQKWFSTEGKAIRVMVNPNLKDRAGRMAVSVVTRPAATPEEKAIHPRFPQLVE